MLYHPEFAHLAPLDPHKLISSSVDSDTKDIPPYLSHGWIEAGRKEPMEAEPSDRLHQRQYSNQQLMYHPYVGDSCWMHVYAFISLKYPRGTMFFGAPSFPPSIPGYVSPKSAVEIREEVYGDTGEIADAISRDIGSQLSSRGASREGECHIQSV